MDREKIVRNETSFNLKMAQYLGLHSNQTSSNCCYLPGGQKNNPQTSYFQCFGEAGENSTLLGKKWTRRKQCMLVVMSFFMQELPVLSSTKIKWWVAHLLNCSATKTFTNHGSEELLSKGGTFLLIKKKKI